MTFLFGGQNVQFSSEIKNSIQERLCVVLLANMNSAAANMGQSVICVWDG